MKKHLLILKTPNQPNLHLLILHNNRINFKEAFEKVLSNTQQAGFTGLINQIPLQYWTAQGLCPIELEYTETNNLPIQSPGFDNNHSLQE